MSQVSNQVTIVDFDMPFLSMVNFMIKWAVASIPAMIIIFMLFSMFGGCVAALVN
jgi:hypothetical protein